MFDIILFNRYLRTCTNGGIEMGENDSLSDKEKLIKLISNIENENIIKYLLVFIQGKIKAGN